MGRWKDGYFTVWKGRKEECVGASDEESVGDANEKKGSKKRQIEE